MPQQQRQKQKQLQTEQQAQEQQQQLTIFKIAHNGMGVGRIRVRGKEHRTIRGGIKNSNHIYFNLNIINFFVLKTQTLNNQAS